MNPVVRSVLAVVGGMLVAFVLIALVQVIGMRVYPPPSGLDPANPESIKAAMAMVPLGALLFVLLAYAAGSVAGGWVAARFAPSGKMMHAMIVAALLVGAGLVNLLSIPHPAWFWVASNAIYLLGAWSGAQAAGSESKPPTGTPAKA
jgi:hypothetical protein